jgi:hypothetical protein
MLSPAPKLLEVPFAAGPDMPGFRLFTFSILSLSKTLKLRAAQKTEGN